MRRRLKESWRTVPLESFPTISSSRFSSGCLSRGGFTSRVSKQWATLFRRDCLWQAALLRSYPSSSLSNRWRGPIPRGLCRRRYMALYISRYMALYISRNFFSLRGDMDKIIGHAYLFLKEQLELSSMTPPSGIIHGTVIDQFIACGNSRDMAHDLASQIWIVVLDNLEENEHTFLLLKRLAQEQDVFLPYPYSRSVKVQWRVSEKLFTDFRDCLNCMDYYDVRVCLHARVSCKCI